MYPKCYPIRPQINRVGEEGDDECDRNDGADEEVNEKGDSESLECSPCGGEEESRRLRIPRRPTAPTKNEIEEHEITHFPPRDWCQHCVAGYGISNQHRASKETDEDKLGITVGLDYCFMHEGERETGVSPILIMYDENRKALWVLPVENKGAVETVGKWACDKLDEAGYRGMPVTLRSDQEESIVNLKKLIAVKRAAETPLIESPVRESKSNGSVERAVRTWRSHFLTLKSHFESRVRLKLESHHPLRQWLATWAGEAILKYKVQQNGRTSYEMMTGHRCKHFVVAFGEKVAFKMNSLKTGHDKAETTWSEGYFLGVISRTTEYLIGTADGVIKCAHLKRLPKERAYDPACLDEVKCTVYEYIKDGAKSTVKRVRFADERPREMSEREPIESARGTPAPYGLRLTKRDFLEHGYTMTCPGCVWVQSGEAGTSRRHTPECRARMTAAI